MSGPAKEISPIRSYVTPFATDVMFYEFRARTLPKNQRPEYGAPHPNSKDWPDHELVFIQTAKDHKEEMWFYAAKRDSQDAYNFEFISGSPDFKFDTVKRLYVIKRSDFEPNNPLRGAAMPDVPQGKFSDGFVLFQKEQVRSPVQELDSLYVFVTCVYVRRVSLSKVVLDLQTGRSKRSVTTIYYRGEFIAPGVEVGAAAADPTLPYWGLQPNGVFRELEQLSEDFFAITESIAIPGGTVTPPNGGNPGTLNPPNAEIVDRPVPKVDDYIVHFTAGFLEIPYGTAHPTRPGFFLTYIKPADETGLLYEYFFAKSFIDQHRYNFEISSGDILTRAYIVPRDAWVNGDVLPDPAVGDKIPSPGTPILFDQYGFTHSYQSRADKELDSHFVVVIHVFQQIVKSRREFDEDTYHDIEITETIIAKGATVPTSSPGMIVTVDRGHTRYNVMTSRRLVPLGGGPGLPAFPVELPDVLSDANYDFPPILERVEWKTIWAYAISTGAPPAWDQDFGVNFKIKRPSAGPYATRTKRFLTNNPDAIRNAYPLQAKPVPQSESIFVGAAWYQASPDHNQAKADVITIDVPPTVHPEIRITPPDGLAMLLYSDKLDATPGYAAFSSGSILNIGFRSMDASLGLYIAEVIQLNGAGVYSGSTFDWGSGSIGSGAISTVIEIPPVIITAGPSADNRQALGTATPESVIRVYRVEGGREVEYGRGASLVDGTYSVPLTTQFRNPVTLRVTARKIGLLSNYLAYDTLDLAPLQPEASIVSTGPYALIHLVGRAEPLAGIRIDLTPVAQIVRLTVVGTSSAATSVKVSMAASVLGASSPVEVIVPIPTGKVPSEIANLVRDQLLMTTAITTHFIINSSGANVTIEWKRKLMHDPSGMLTMQPGLGISYAESVVTQIGRGSVTLAADPGGAFEYFFSPALADDSMVTITAFDDGGDSPPLNIVASLGAPPEPVFARFPRISEGDAADIYNHIIGEATAGAGIVVRYDGLDLASGTVAPDGTFDIALPKTYVYGETLQLFVHVAGNPSKRSPIVTVVAHNLNMPDMVFSEIVTTNTIYGTLPELATLIAPVEDIRVVVRREGMPLTEHDVELFPNGEWQFNMLTAMGLDTPPEGGQRYEVFYRFPQGDAKPQIKAYPNVPIPTPSFAWHANTFKTFLPEMSPSGNGGQLPNGRWLSPAFPSFLKEESVPIGNGNSYTITCPLFGTYFKDRGSMEKDVVPVPILFVRVPYMGPGTRVNLRYPGASKPAQEFIFATPPEAERRMPQYTWNQLSFHLPESARAENRPPAHNCVYKEFTTLVASYWPSHLPEPTLAELREIIPPVMVVRVTSPDGRVIETEVNRHATTPALSP